MEYRELGKTGLKVSVLGFGASPLGGVYGNFDEAEAIRGVHEAVNLGVNFIDVSPFYGVTKAETILGKALVQIPRDAYILATKVGRYDVSEFDFSAERVTRSIDESLRRLQVDTIDLIQCHDIEYGSLQQVMDETIPALRRVQAAGKVRFIGISGLPLKIFTTVADQTEIDTILSYCHYTLNDTSLATILPAMKEKGIGVINASPLSMGLLTEQGPPDWHLASPELRAQCAAAARYCRSQGADIVRLALQFSTSHTDIATTLVGIANTEQIRTNCRWITEPMDTELLRAVQAILAPVHNQTWLTGRPENSDMPFSNAGV